MRHRIETRKLGRSSTHRAAMLRNMVTSLIDKGRITTTLEKAKELRRVADRMVTLGKKGDLAARRRASSVVRGDAALKKLFSEVALWSETRAGGYTRILQIGTRPGDGATKAIIEFVDRPKAAPVETHGKKGGAKAKAPGKAPKTEKAPAKKKPASKGEKKSTAAPKHTPQKRGHGKAPASSSGS